MKTIATQRLSSGRCCKAQVQTRARTSRTQVRCSAAPEQQAAQPQPSASVCPTCGVDMSKKPFGCDGTGREVGGMGAIPGFGWWPIKAYKPCSELTAAGMSYTRRGQGTNEILFGGSSLNDAARQKLKEKQ